MKIGKRAAVVALFVAAGLAAGATWLGRVETRPCGRLDGGSRCVSSVALDVAALGLDPAHTRLDHQGVAFGPNAERAVIGVTEESAQGVFHSIVAVVDTRTGRSVRILRDLQGDAGGGESVVDAVAFSADGRLVASWAHANSGDTSESGLVVQDAQDGRILRPVGLDSAGGSRCLTGLAFSPDATELRCSDSLIDLASGRSTVLQPDAASSGRYYGGYRGGLLAIAPDGTAFRSGRLEPVDGEPAELTPPVEAPRAALDQVAFSPDSRFLMQASLAGGSSGWRRLVPAAFSTRTVIGVWTVKTRTLERTLATDKRYRAFAWSPDAARFGAADDELRLDVFDR